MKVHVLDSYAILAFLFNENGSEKVTELLEKAVDTERLLFIAAPNWAEVRYMVERKVGVQEWSNVRSKLRGLPIEIVSADETLAELAGSLKVSKKMSLADCFAAALAKQKDADLYTGDPEFRSVEDDIKIVWLKDKAG